MAADLGLYLLEGSRAIAPGGQLHTRLKHHPTTPISNTLKGWTLWVSPALWCTPLHLIVHHSQPVLTADWPEDKFLPLLYQQQSRLNCHRRVGTVHSGGAGPQAQETWQLHLVHRNKHQEAKMKGQNKTPEKH